MLPSWKQAILPLLLCLVMGGSVLLGACSLTEEEPPLPDSTFSRVLVDFHLLSARKRRPEPLPAGLNDSLLAHHGVKRSDFEATLQYYTRRPDAFASLYDSVIDTLKALKSRRRSSPAGIPDSVRQRMSQETRD